MFTIHILRLIKSLTNFLRDRVLSQKAFICALLWLIISLSTMARVIQANEIDRANYLSLLEKAIIHEMNLARQEPKKYAVFLEQMKWHYEGTLFKPPGSIPILTTEGVSAVNEAIQFLRSVHALPPLNPSKGMSLGAKQHVEDQGPKGAMGHQGSDNSKPADRVNRYGKWQGTVGENIAYNNDNARDVILGLIIDDGVAHRGHRNNLFDAAFCVVGVACGYHQSYRNMCVITFAGKFLEKDSTLASGKSRR